MRKYSINLWVAILCLMCIQQVQAQDNIPIQGQVVDGTTGEPLSFAAILIKGHSAGTETDLDGKFAYEIWDKYINDTLYFYMLGYNPYEIAIRDAMEMDKVEVRLETGVYELVSAVVVQPIILKNVVFEYNKANLKASSSKELDKLYKYLKKRSGLEVEISGHTDSKGTDAYNQKLSQERAVSVMNYLVKKGIKQERLTAVGYGEADPLADNSTEEGRQKNRRVEMKILIDYNAEEPEVPTTSSSGVASTTTIPKPMSVSTPAPKPTPKPKPVLVETDVELTGTSSAKEDDLIVSMEMRDNIASHMKKGTFQGSVLVAKDKNVVYRGGTGYADLSKEQKIKANTPFRIGEMTELFTAVLVLQQVEKGNIDLNGKISDYLPNYPHKVARNITIHQLLSHTSGLLDFENLPQSLPKNRHTRYSKTGFLKLIWNLDPLFDAGEAYHYSRFNYFLLSLILEQKTASTYEDLLDERILSPLNMNRTWVDNETTAAKSVAGYNTTLNGLVNASDYNSTTAFAAADIVSTTSDLFKLEQALSSNTLLGKTSRKRLMTPVVDDYTYAGRVMTDDNGTAIAVMSKGSIRGYESLMVRFIEDQETIVLLSNVSDMKLSDLLQSLKLIMNK